MEEKKVKMQLLNGSTGALTVPVKEVRAEKVVKGNEFSFSNQSNENEVKFVYTMPRVKPVNPIVATGPNLDTLG